MWHSCDRHWLYDVVSSAVEVMEHFRSGFSVDLPENMSGLGTTYTVLSSITAAGFGLTTRRQQEPFQLNRLEWHVEDGSELAATFPQACKSTVCSL